MFEDDQVLFESGWAGNSYRKLILYDPKNSTIKFNFLNTCFSAPKVCVESLISLWS